MDIQCEEIWCSYKFEKDVILQEDDKKQKINGLAEGSIDLTNHIPHLLMQL